MLYGREGMELRVPSSTTILEGQDPPPVSNSESAYRPRPWAGTVTNVEIPAHWEETVLKSMVY